MDTSQLLRQAWEAVEQSGVPESLQEVAFREAVEHLRSGESPGGDAGASQQQRSGKGKQRKSSPGKEDQAAGAGASIDEATFFAQLSDESGVEENDLRDVLSLSGRTVLVTPPTRNLGSSRARQARTAIALVAGARSFGLGERPVDADAVRKELDRKRCYDQPNFAAKHLGPMVGFNAGANRNEIMTTSRWVDEFSAAVDQALGRSKDSEAEPTG